MIYSKQFKFIKGAPLCGLELWLPCSHYKTKLDLKQFISSETILLSFNVNCVFNRKRHLYFGQVFAVCVHIIRRKISKFKDKELIFIVILLLNIFSFIY